MNSKILSDEIITSYHVNFEFINALEQFGFVQIESIQNKTYVIIDDLNDFEQCIRLYYDLNINLEGIDVIKNLLQKIKNIESINNQLNKKLEYYKNHYENLEM